MPVVAVESVHINRGAISYMERVLLVMEEDAEHPGQPLLDDIFQLVFQWSKIRRLHFEGRS
jgi:hypothetical protein